MLGSLDYLKVRLTYSSLFLADSQMVGSLMPLLDHLPLLVQRTVHRTLITVSQSYLATLSRTAVGFALRTLGNSP